MYSLVIKFIHRSWACWPSRPFLAFCLLCSVWQEIWRLQGVSQNDFPLGPINGGTAWNQRGKKKPGNYFGLFLCIPGWPICPSLFRTLLVSALNVPCFRKPCSIVKPRRSVTLYLLPTVFLPDHLCVSSCCWKAPPSLVSEMASVVPASTGWPQTLCYVALSPPSIPSDSCCCC